MRFWLVVSVLANCASLAICQSANASTSVTVPSKPAARPVSPNLYGYSIEPVWLPDYVSSNVMSKLLSYITDTIGVPPEIRVGGSTSDYTYFHPEQSAAYQILPNRTTVKALNISAGYYQPLSTYFPSNTKFTYTLNFRSLDTSISTSLLEAQSIISILGPSLTLFELGNELDHFVGDGYRPSGRWNVSDLVPQWRNLTAQITSSSWYLNATSPPKFQAAVFADPPGLTDQQVDTDDMSVPNLTAAGLVDPALISAYCVHLYPQSTCDAPRRARLSLNLLSDHSVLYTNVSQYIPSVAAAEAAGAPLVMGETNSASCSGRSGISDVFTAALWAVDYVFMSASLGIQKVFFHLGSSSEYSAFIPLPYTYQGQSLTAGVRANFYSHYFTALVLESGANLTITALSDANASDFSGYAFYDAQTAALTKLVFLDMGVWNGSTGLSNPSTLSTTDSTFRSEGQRPSRQLSVQTEWAVGTELRVLRLQAPGSNAKSGVVVDGVGFDLVTGERGGESANETTLVGSGGVVEVRLERGEGVLIEP
ncbi:MAG: hypothetical protein Q9160_005208 [Pyrenula sp. 1 TL-2023]